MVIRVTIISRYFLKAEILIVFDLGDEGIEPSMKISFSFKMETILFARFSEISTVSICTSALFMSFIVSEGRTESSEARLFTVWTYS